MIELHLIGYTDDAEHLVFDRDGDGDGRYTVAIDGRWRVSVRFEERGRPRTATWLMDPEGRRLSPASELAKVLAEPETVKRRRR